METTRRPLQGGGGGGGGGGAGRGGGVGGVGGVGGEGCAEGWCAWTGGGVK